MSKKEAAIIKVLASVSQEEIILSSEQEEMLARAMDPEKQFLYSVEQLFTDEKTD